VALKGTEAVLDAKMVDHTYLGASVEELKRGFLAPRKEVQKPCNLEGKSLASLSNDERVKLRKQIRAVVSAKIERVLPQKASLKLSDPLKQCYMFLKKFRAGELPA